MEQEKEQLLTVLAKHLRHLKGEDAFDWQKPLKEYGLDSMSSINLLFDIEDQLGIVFPDELLNGQTFSSGDALFGIVEGLKANSY